MCPGLEDYSKPVEEMEVLDGRSNAVRLRFSDRSAPFF